MIDWTEKEWQNELLGEYYGSTIENAEKLRLRAQFQLGRK